MELMPSVTVDARIKMIAAAEEERRRERKEAKKRHRKEQNSKISNILAWTGKVFRGIFHGIMTGGGMRY